MERNTIKTTLCIILTIALLIPAFSIFTVGVSAGTYEEAKNGDLLATVNFKPDGEWNPTIGESGDNAADVEVSSDGRSVKFTLTDGANMRARWGDELIPALPLTEGVKYTYIYDVTFGNEDVHIGIYPDWSNGLVMQGNGRVRWFNWGSNKDNNEISWTEKTDIPGLSQTFAVSMDYDAKTLTCYVKKQDGSFAKVIEKYRDMIWDDSVMDCMVFVGKYSKSTGTGKIAPGATHTVELSNLKIYKGDFVEEGFALKTLFGASVRLDQTTGLRFTGLIGKQLYGELAAKYGEKNVKLGMLITPTDYLTVHHLEFTKEALDACNYISGVKYNDVKAATVLENEDGTAYLINCVLSNVQKGNYTRNFSAIAYIEVNGTIIRYSDYVESDHSRSISYVSEQALADVSTEKANEYQYTSGSKYSPYTANERKILDSFSGLGTISVMQYNVEKYDSKGGWEDGRNPQKAMDTIVTVSPDLVTLNEINSEWNESPKYYEKTLTKNGYTKVSADTSGGNMWVDIFYKTEKFTPISTGSEHFKATATALKVPNDENANQDLDNIGKKGRLFTWALLTEKETGKKVLFIGTHLHYGGTGTGHEEDDKLRRYEIKTLLAWINTRTFSYDAIVITGDMNSHYKSGNGKINMELFKKAGFAITVETAAVKDDTYGTLDGTEHTTRKEWIFDYVLTKNGNTGGKAECQYYTVIDNFDSDSGHYPSDHLPILSKIVLK